MGRKHSKNAGVMGSEALTYHEKKALGYGTATERLGKVRRRSAEGQHMVHGHMLGRGACCWGAMLQHGLLRLACSAADVIY